MALRMALVLLVAGWSASACELLVRVDQNQIPVPPVQDASVEGGDALGDGDASGDLLDGSADAADAADAAEPTDAPMLDTAPDGASDDDASDASPDDAVVVG